jgi:hypothetical protein
MHRFLEGFHDPEQEAQRAASAAKSFIPERNDHLLGLAFANQRHHGTASVRQRWLPARSASVLREGTEFALRPHRVRDRL